MSCGIYDEKTYLRDLLNVPYGLETNLNLTEGGHVAGLGGRRAHCRGLGRNTTKRTPSEHSREREDEGAVEVVVRAVDVDFGNRRNRDWGFERSLRYLMADAVSHDIFKRSSKFR